VIRKQSDRRLEGRSDAHFLTGRSTFAACKLIGLLMYTINDGVWISRQRRVWPQLSLRRLASYFS